MKKTFFRALIFLTLHWKRQGCSTSVSGAGGDLLLFVFNSSFGLCIYLLQYFFHVFGNEASNKNFLLELMKRRSKVYERICQMDVLSMLTNAKHFPKAVNQPEFHYGLFQNYWDLLSRATFRRVHSNPNKLPYPLWQNKYS